MIQKKGDVAALLDSARSASAAHRLAVSGTDSLAIRLPDAAVSELVRALAGTAKNLVQIVPFSARTDHAERFSDLVWRQRSSEGASIHRLYLVPFGVADLDRVEIRMKGDRRDKIKARHLHVGASSGIYEPMTNLWIIDDAVAVYEEFGNGGPATWVVSGRQEDVEAARARWARLWNLRNEPPRVPEPLLDSADLFHSLADLSCTGHQVDRAGCAWYHGPWQYLRLFNMVSSPSWHGEFYREWLARQLSGKETPRALITGSADYATLAFVLAAADDKSRLDAHVLDLCQTPLLANRWLANREAVDITIHQRDFLADRGQLEADLGKFDLVVSDAFLTRFSPEDAPQVLARWRGLLCEGGSVVTTVRLYATDIHRQSVTREINDYLLRLYERAKSSHWLLKIDLDELLDAARAYALKMTSWNLGDADDVIELFTESGFRVIHQESASVDGELAQTKYLRIVAQP
jgi:hypothetical protein